MKLQVLVTTMYEKDLSIYKRMNLQSDTVIANQSNEYSYLSDTIDGHHVQMITTKTRGLSKNRNIAMTCVDKDVEYIMFSDDDLVFYNGYEELIEAEFKAHPEADAIKFMLKDLSQTRKLSQRPTKKFKKATKWNTGSTGVWGLVVKHELLLKYNLHFNEYFGPGTENYCGEDSIFIKDMLKSGIKMYFSPVFIAGIDQSESTWFEGYNEKYFIVGGMVAQVNFPIIGRYIVPLQAYRFTKRNCKLSYSQILKAYYHGMKKYKGKN
jgi:hypothetical protein